MSWPKPIQVVGLGSPLGLDQIGWQIINGLQTKTPSGIKRYCLYGGQQLLDVIEPSGTLLLIDAMKGYKKLGDRYHLTWPNQQLENFKSHSSHSLSIDEVLQLGQTLGLLPRVIEIFGIEIGNELSSNILEPAQIPELLQARDALIAYLNGRIDESIQESERE